MKTLLGLGSTCLALQLAAFGQTPLPAPRAHNAQNVQVEETPYFGVSALDISPDRAKALKLKEDRGVEVTFVEPDSAAAKAGVKVGDVIMQFNGQKVEGWEHLKRLVRETPIHRDVKIVVWRNGAEQTVSAAIGGRKETQVDLGGGTMMAVPAWPASPATPFTMQPTPSMPLFPAMPSLDLPQFRALMPSSSLGIVGEAIGQEAQLAEFFGVKEGVLVRSVNKDSAAEKAGMKAGDIIVKVDDSAIATPQQISSTLRSVRGKTAVSVTVVRNKKEMSLTVTPDATGYYRGGLWDPKNNVLLELFQPGGKN
ncbi:MAG TPA: PDZ domain-containing protein [Bryobacteraceae bacterium]|jgi:serine protease Do|nr:PDZ domain-containing protein [Bryobacteraceae bacterium]